MRLWSLHPKYLDQKGIVAVWREGLLAKKVLEGNTKGYKNHSQLIRFKALADPLSAINSYLVGIYRESVIRGYEFDVSKVGATVFQQDIIETSGQLNYEMEHLLNKLRMRPKEAHRNYVGRFVRGPLGLSSGICCCVW